MIPVNKQFGCVDLQSGGRSGNTQAPSAHAAPFSLPGAKQDLQTGTGRISPEAGGAVTFTGGGSGCHLEPGSGTAPDGGRFWRTGLGSLRAPGTMCPELGEQLTPALGTSIAAA